MELSISCPLCSQPGFSDVNSLWLTLIRVTTRQLTCPVCQEVLCGLDKLTIHLVSHSLHDQLIQACLASNFSTPPAILAKGVQFNKSSQCVESATIQESVSTGPPHNPSSSSYVLVNLPSLGNVSMKEMVPGSVSSNVGLTPSKEDMPFPYLPPPKPGYPQVLVAKANDSPLVTDSIPPLTPVMCPDTMSDPLKLVNLDHSRERTTTIKDVPVIKRISCGNVLNHNSPHQLPQIKPSEHEGSLNHQIASIPKVESPSHVSDLPICCQVCGLTFKDNNIALLHQQLIHHQNPPDDYQVSSKLEDRPHSSKQRSRRGNVNQLRDGSLHRFPCHICNKVFRMRGSLMVHLRVAHSPNETMGFASKLGGVSTALSPQSDVTSKLCLQNLSIQEGTQSFLIDDNISDNGHKQTKENDLTIQKTSDLTLQNISTSLGYKHNSSMFTKNLTSDSNTSESTVSTMVVPSPYGQTESIGMIFPCNLCNKTYSKEILLQQHLKSHDSKQWECDVCFKSFTTKYFLKKHKRLHTGEMPYTCGICNKSFTFQQSYHKHLLYHSDEKPHTCSECGRAFKELSTLHNHQRIHTGEKPWACESCGKCFRQRVSYLVHRRIHTGAMPYQCTVCFKSFRYKVSQRTHKCVVQSSGDAPSPPADLLQQLLESPSKEVENNGALQTAELSGPLNKPQTSIKNQHPLPHPNPNKVYCLTPEDQTESNFTLKSKDSSELLSSTKCSNAGIQAPLTHQPALDHHDLCNGSQFPSPSVQLSHCDVSSKVVPSPTVKLDCLSDKHSSISRESHADLPLLPQCTPPSSSDFNIDLLQDILSMVMSPTDSTPSPSSQMRHLSLVGQNEEDLESGLELRQLLYGPCDSDNM